LAILSNLGILSFEWHSFEIFSNIERMLIEGKKLIYELKINPKTVLSNFGIVKG
jgi:hypothetical protein